MEAHELEKVEERWCNAGVDVLMGSLSMGRAMLMPMPNSNCCHTALAGRDWGRTGRWLLKNGPPPAKSQKAY